jgi:hypothetical protein
MLDTLSRETFQSHVGETFRIAFTDGEIELTLVLATPITAGDPEPDPAKRSPFSLLFRGGPPDRFLPQRTYDLEHPELGNLSIFLVPLGPDAEGMRYEAVFT